ncbi:hypothetical protein IEQ34_003585 [Dendrobium chrysotoxum]|uniref:Uncharacterized protein n=1 Tax=Dendrobium chrysotoxum TaxID=161865 RepID=A0AAV7HI51_DENCH|nr:hypothetical protein IEQ34_003585 [Dendrobium chrysotoxum]
MYDDIQLKNPSRQNKYEIQGLREEGEGSNSSTAPGKVKVIPGSLPHQEVEKDSSLYITSRRWKEKPIPIRIARNLWSPNIPVPRPLCTIPFLVVVTAVSFKELRFRRWRGSPICAARAQSTRSDQRWRRQATGVRSWRSGSTCRGGCLGHCGRIWSRGLRSRPRSITREVESSNSCARTLEKCPMVIGSISKFLVQSSVDSLHVHFMSRARKVDVQECKHLGVKSGVDS